MYVYYTYTIGETTLYIAVLYVIIRQYLHSDLAIV